MTGGAVRAPGFWRICGTDAYLFKMCFIFLPLLVLVLVYDGLTGAPAEDFMLPGLLSALLVGIIAFRWSAIAGVFQDHEALPCRIQDISPGGGLLGIQVYISFSSRDGSEGGCFLVKFNSLVQSLRKGDGVTVLWNRKNMYVIRDAYVGA